LEAQSSDCPADSRCAQYGHQPRSQPRASRACVRSGPARGRHPPRRVCRRFRL